MSRKILLVTLLLFTFTTYGVNLSHKREIILNSVAEPSGITYNPQTELIYIVGDEGYIYECNSSGEVLRSQYLGSFDLEGITYNIDNNNLYCLEEKSPRLLEVDIKTLSIITIFSLKSIVKRGTKQFESITYSPKDQIHPGQFFIGSSIKSSKSGLITSLVLKNKNVYKANEYKLPLWDIAGLSYSNNTLLMVSDNKDILATLNLTSSEYKAYDISGSNQEGIATLGDSKILILDEVNKILVHTLK